MCHLLFNKNIGAITSAMFKRFGHFSDNICSTAMDESYGKNTASDTHTCNFDQARFRDVSCHPVVAR